jgi:WD40 repeat protein
MRLLWYILAAMTIGAMLWLAWYVAMSDERSAWRGVIEGREPKEPMIAPANAPRTTPALAAPLLVIEKSALDVRDADADLRNAQTFALNGVSLGAGLGGRSARRRTLSSPNVIVKWQTIRIWALDETGRDPQFRLANILRPPFGTIGVGAFTARAVSSDRVLVAAGAILQDETYQVYVFDRANGRILHAIEKIPETVTALAFSKDGKFLAVGLNRGGIRFYRTTDWTWIAQDSQYSQLVRAIDFDATGWAAATGLDGQVRLYNPTFRQVKRVQLSQASLLQDVSFSPDGTQIAVGAYDKAVVTLLDRKTLQETRILSFGGPADWLSDVAWAQTGRTLYASGSARAASGRYAILRWTLGTEDPPAALDGLRFADQISDLAPFGAGGVMAYSQEFDTEDPTETLGIVFGAMDASGVAVARRTGDSSQLQPGLMTDDMAAFRVNTDGTLVEAPGGQDRLLRLDLMLRRATLAASSTLDLAPPRATHPEAQLQNWRGASAPELTNLVTGKEFVLKLDTDERALSYAFSPDKPSLYIGTNHALRLYSLNGVLLQNVPTSAAVQRVNVSPDGRHAIAALRDGTIRWYDTKNWNEQLAVYISDDPQKWIAWTPDGYYDAGPGADALIGWQINRGPKREPLFYPARQFSDLYYRSGLATQVISRGQPTTQPEPEALLARLPPIVTILDVRETAASEVTVDFRVEAPSGQPVTHLSALIDGVKMPVDLTDETNVRIRPLPPNQRLRLTFPIPSSTRATRSVTLTAGYAPGELGVATSRGFAVSQNTMASGPVNPPRLFALVVGVSDYADANIGDLTFAANDAKEIAKRLRAQMSRFYGEDMVKVVELTEEKATKAAILAALKDIRTQATKDDVTMVFLAGHGVPDPEQPELAGGQNYYFVSHDADFTGRRLKDTAVPYQEIITYITDTLGRRMVFLDTCYAGLVIDPDINGIVNALGPRGVYVAAATNGRSLAFEDPAWRHGALTSALLTAFDGAAAGVTSPGGNNITSERLKPFLREEIRRLTNFCQDPAILDDNIDEFAFARTLNGESGPLRPPPTTARDCRTS